MNAVAYAGFHQVRRIYDVMFQDLVAATLLANYLYCLVSLGSDNLRKSAVEQIAELTDFVSLHPSLISSVGAHCSKLYWLQLGSISKLQDIEIIMILTLESPPSPPLVSYSADSRSTKNFLKAWQHSL